MGSTSVEEEEGVVGVDSTSPLRFQEEGQQAEGLHGLGVRPVDVEGARVMLTSTVLVCKDEPISLDTQDTYYKFYCSTLLR